jgi:ribosomal protein S18 acetylase RimI-like enzyme
MGNSHLNIRDAFREDALGIATVHVETWQASYAGILSESLLVQMDSLEQVRSWDTLLQRPDTGTRILVAELGDYTSQPNQIIGFGSCGPAREASTEERTRTGEVFTLYVLPDWQGRGVGKLLLDTLLGCLTADGYPNARLWVLGENPSRFFYEHAGGQLIDERTRALGGQRKREIAYNWQLRQDAHQISSPFGSKTDFD